MSYIPIEVNDSTPLTAKLMNYIGTQYASALPDMNGHNHDSRYYTKTAADLRFYKGSSLKPDADKVDGKHWNEIIGNLLPIKTVLGWNGTDSNVPDGWHIADGGTYSGVQTPEMRGRIPLGAGDLYAVGATGGSTTINNAGGTATIGDHILTISEMAVHYHNWDDNYNVGSGYDQWSIGSWITVTSQTTTSRSATTSYNHDAADEAHNHSTNSVTLNGINIVPLYMAKYFICKIS